MSRIVVCLILATIISTLIGAGLVEKYQAPYVGGAIAIVAVVLTLLGAILGFAWDNHHGMRRRSRL